MYPTVPYFARCWNPTRVTYMDGSTLKLMRKKAKLSQAELGKLVGYSRHAVMDWESGRYAMPYNLPEKLAEANLSLLSAKIDPVQERAHQIAATYRAQRDAGVPHEQLMAYLRKLPDMSPEAWKLIGQETNS